MKRLVLILLIFAPAILFAANKEWKEGYIVTISNDTIKGYIAYRNSMADQKNCLFKSSPDSLETIYTPQQLLSYRYNDGLYFQSKNVNAPHLKGKYFIECLLEGFINLYSTQIQYSKNIENKVSMSSDVSVYLVEMPGDDYWMEMINPGDMYNSSLQSLKNDKKMESLFSGKIEELKNDIPKASYSRDKMTALFKKYHDLVCTDRKCIVYKEKKSAKKHFLTVYTRGGFQKKSTGDPKRALNMHLGAGYSLPLGKFSDRLLFNIYLDIAYLNDNDSQKSHKLQTLGLFNQFSIEGRLMPRKVQPLLEAGFYQQGYFIPIKTPDYVYGYSKYSMGISLSAGIVVKVKNGEIPIKINGYFPFATTPTDIIYADEYFQRLNNQCGISVGYRFQLKKKQ